MNLLYLKFFRQPFAIQSQAKQELLARYMVEDNSKGDTVEEVQYELRNDYRIVRSVLRNLLSNMKHYEEGEEALWRQTC